VLSFFLDAGSMEEEQDRVCNLQGSQVTSEWEQPGEVDLALPALGRGGQQGRVPGRGDA
jgi:hypothetical protein